MRSCNLRGIKDWDGSQEVQILHHSLMDKREYRELKRTLKKAGNKKLRNHLKENLRKNPEESHWEDMPDYGKCKTKDMNKNDKG